VCWGPAGSGRFGELGAGESFGNRDLGKGIGEQGMCDSVHRNKCGNVHGSI
jgi:hypothetical protein